MKSFERSRFAVHIYNELNPDESLRAVRYKMPDKSTWQLKAEWLKGLPAEDRERMAMSREEIQAEQDARNNEWLKQQGL